MFTGLIEATGVVDAVKAEATGSRVQVATNLAAELADGDSIAVNGVCLTVTARTPSGFSATVSPETLRVTTLGRAVSGTRVNLERPLKHEGRLGGHFVLGHVDGVGRVISIAPDGDCYWLDVEVPGELAGYLIPKGSIAIDGISLTIAALDGARVRIQIVPFTWSHTALGSLAPGDGVNVETDVIGKYVARLMNR
ncbi:MAG TPA: riboflavin synthase [Vicinamibacterales bacterium]|nr:riboflavin synthase [Vicinamibacterales bacterium]